MSVLQLLLASYTTGALVTGWAQVMAYAAEDEKASCAERVAAVFTTIFWPVTIAWTTFEWMKSRHE